LIKLQATYIPKSMQRMVNESKICKRMDATDEKALTPIKETLKILSNPKPKNKNSGKRKV
jgi:hypothetical protein